MSRGIHSFRKALALGLFTVAYVALFYFIIALKAEAEPLMSDCGPEEQIFSYLKDQFGEEPTGGGGVLLPAGRQRVEVFASPEGRTFTVVAIDVDHRACILLVGVDWEAGVTQASGQEM